MFHKGRLLIRRVSVSNSRAGALSRYHAETRSSCSSDLCRLSRIMSAASISRQLGRQIRCCMFRCARRKLIRAYPRETFEVEAKPISNFTSNEGLEACVFAYRTFTNDYSVSDAHIRLSETTSTLTMHPSEVHTPVSEPRHVSGKARRTR